MDWFHVAEMEPGVHLVAEPGHVSSWLIHGRDRSVLARWEQGLISPPVDSLLTMTSFCASIYPAVWSFNLALRARGLGGIRVGTVDDMQGQEERIIFISTVLSKPETLPALGGAKGGEPQLGFWRNPRRFNVAITRAKCLLVILGHPLVLIEVSTTLQCTSAALPPF